MKYSLSFYFIVSICLIAPLSTSAQTLSDKSKAKLISDAIPSDTPYIFGYEPQWKTLEKSSVDHQRAETFDLIKSLWNSATLKADELSSSWTDEERSIWRFFKDLPLPKSKGELANIGFDQPSAFWLYGLGLTPALILEVPSPDKFRAWVLKHLSPLEHGFVEVHQGSRGYWRRPLKRWTFLLRFTGHRLHLALIPKTAEPILLSYFLRDEESMNVTDRLRDRFSQLPQHSKASGFISLQKLIDLFFGSSIPILKHSAQSLGLPNPLFSACEKDLRSIGDSLQTLTLGMRRLEGDRVDIFTHLTISSEHMESIRQLQNVDTPPLSLKTSQNSGGIGSRMHFGQLITLLEERGLQWRAQPWSCPLLIDFNSLTKMSDNPQFSLIKSLLSPLHGFTLTAKRQANDLSQTTPAQTVPAQTAPAQSLTAVDKNLKTHFSGWLELYYPSPQLLLNLFTSIAKTPPLSKQHYQVDGKLRDISYLNPNLNPLLLSLNPKRLMISVGEWGKGQHQSAQNSMAQHARKLPIDTKVSADRDSLKHPLFWLSLPANFSQWLRAKFIDYQNRTKNHKTNNPQTKEISIQKSIFRLFDIYLRQHGLLFRVRLDTKSL